MNSRAEECSSFLCPAVVFGADNGVKLPEINVGNMSTKANSRQVAKSVAVTEEDIENFKYLDQKGCHLYHQMVPAEDKEDFMKLLSK